MNQEQVHCEFEWSRLQNNQLVTLKNGAKEQRCIINGIMASLRALQKRVPLLFEQLVLKCHYPKHQFPGDSEAGLMRLRMLEPEGHVHSEIRNVVLSAVRMSGNELIIGSPFLG